MKDFYVPIFDCIGIPALTMRDIYGHFLWRSGRVMKNYFKRRKKLCRR